MAIDESAIRAALRSWLITTTGLGDSKVIMAHQNAPRPQPPYLVLNDDLALATVGMDDEERRTGTPGLIQRVGQRRLSVSINAYGPGARQAIASAQSGLQTYAVRIILDAAGLAVIDRGRANNLTGMLDTRWEERYQLDVIFGLADVSTEEVGYIDRVEHTDTYHAGGDPPQDIVSTGTWE